MGEPISPQDKHHLEDTVAYLVRNPLSLKKLVYLDDHRAVLYRSRINPSLRRNFEALDPLEWLARMSDHIPALRAGPHAVLRRVRQPHPRRPSVPRERRPRAAARDPSPALVAQPGPPRRYREGSGSLEDDLRSKSNGGTL